MHKWTDQECETVCSVFRDEFVNSFNSVETAVKKIKALCPVLEKGSIRMKISNTVCICDELGIKHNCTISSLSNYSQQHRKAFKVVFGV